MKKRFIEMYSGVCDHIFVAPTLPLIEELDLSGIVSQSPIINREVGICPSIFYEIYVSADGLVAPCCQSVRGRKLALGNIQEANLYEIWNGEARRHFLKKQLLEKRFSISACRTCISPNNSVSETDNLDAYSEEVLRRL